jgi:hypothetical protein
MTWTVRLHTIPEKALRALEDYCIEASQKDKTFQWLGHIDPATGKVKYITIECTSKDHAYRRGSLFHHRFGCYFEVEWRTN